MRDQERAVQETLRNPDQVRRSRTDHDVYLFYKLTNNKRWTCAVAKKLNGKDMHLNYLARKYIWWKTPDQALSDWNHFLAQIMTLGTIEDCGWIMKNIGEDELKKALLHPPVGVFNSRSWHYWHYKLGLAHDESDIPPLPKRFVFGENSHEL